MNKEQYDVGDVIDASGNEDYAIITSILRYGVDENYYRVALLTSGKHFDVYLETMTIVIKGIVLELL